ncbi:hypothetical protein A9HBioS_3100 [Pseudomonas koreensis]|uniref:Uncharacterized protein n=1 Tax=Pseudomonas koreensis TaxID=198620 RepID=A0AA94EMP2_9PSED|nr:hypothetical protein A9HBioS_3100 [Pseudomonas koreensis]
MTDRFRLKKLIGGPCNGQAVHDCWFDGRPYVTAATGHGLDQVHHEYRLRTGRFAEDVEFLAFVHSGMSDQSSFHACLELWEESA